MRNKLTQTSDAPWDPPEPVRIYYADGTVHGPEGLDARRRTVALHNRALARADAQLQELRDELEALPLREGKRLQHLRTRERVGRHREAIEAEARLPDARPFDEIVKLHTCELDPADPANPFPGVCLKTYRQCCRELDELERASTGKD